MSEIAISNSLSPHFLSSHSDIDQKGKAKRIELIENAIEQSSKFTG